MSPFVNHSSSGRPSSRDAILRAAGDAFAKRGYSNTRMTAIAAAAGISRTALYKHFPTKSDLLIALNEFVIRDWEEWMNELATSADSTAEFLETWIREALLDSWRITTAQILTSPDTKEDLEASSRSTQDGLRSGSRTIARALRRGVQNGELRPDLDVTATAHVLNSILYSLINTSSMDRPAPTIERQRHIRALVDSLVLGVKK